MNARELKNRFDLAIASIGLAGKPDDINKAYADAVESYMSMKSMDGVEFTLGDEEFERKIDHLTNYNLVRVANAHYEAFKDYKISYNDYRMAVAKCLSSLKDGNNYKIEKELLEDLYNAR